MNASTQYELWRASILLCLFPWAAGIQELYRRSKLRWVVGVLLVLIILLTAFILEVIFLAYSPAIVILTTSVASVKYFRKYLHSRETANGLMAAVSILSFILMTAVCISWRSLIVKI